jgi:hypothetical protein
LSVAELAFRQTAEFSCRLTTVRLKVEENQLVEFFG